MMLYEFVIILSVVVMKIHCIIKVLRIYMTKLFSLAYPEGGGGAGRGSMIF